jgi:hypothetical protein
MDRLRLFRFKWGIRQPENVHVTLNMTMLLTVTYWGPCELSECEESAELSVVFLLRSGREGERNASLEETEGGNDNDSFKASKSLLVPVVNGDTEGRAGVRLRGGRGGGGVEGLSESSIGSGGSGPAVASVAGS